MCCKLDPQYSKVDIVSSISFLIRALKSNPWPSDQRTLQTAPQSPDLVRYLSLLHRKCSLGLEKGLNVLDRILNTVNSL